MCTFRSSLAAAARYRRRVTPADLTRSGKKVMSTNRVMRGQKTEGAGRACVSTFVGVKPADVFKETSCQ